MKKNLKKLASIAIAVVMMMAMMVPAMAAPNQTITVNNTVDGATYELYKVFDATVITNDDNTTGIVYSLLEGDTLSEEMATYFTVENQTVFATDAAKGADGKLTENAITALTNWIADKEPVDTKTGDNSGSVVFGSLDDGYYVIKSTLNTKSAIAVTSISPNPVVNDKVESKPHFSGEGKTSDDGFVAINDVVNYTVSAIVTNYVVETAGATPELVLNYTVSDSFPSFLKDYTLDSIEVVRYTKAAGSEETTKTVLHTLTTDAYKTAFAAKESLVIPWAANGEPLYDDVNGATLEVKYHATVTAEVLTNGTNTVTISYNGEEITDNDVIESNKFQIIKTDANNVLINGAQFNLYTQATGGEPLMLVATDEGYRLAEENENGAAALIDVTNGTLIIAGLDSKETYYLEEIKAPAGYNELTDRQAVTFTEGEDNVAGENSLTTANGITTYTVNGGGIHVINNRGAELPSTGGIGTTIFYVVGGILVVAAGVLLITKKRMSAEG